MNYEKNNTNSKADKVKNKGNLDSKNLLCKLEMNNNSNNEKDKEKNNKLKSKYI